MTTETIETTETFSQDVRAIGSILDLLKARLAELLEENKRLKIHVAELVHDWDTERAECAKYHHDERNF